MLFYTVHLIVLARPAITITSGEHWSCFHTVCCSLVTAWPVWRSEETRANQHLSRWLNGRGPHGLMRAAPWRNHSLTGPSRSPRTRQYFFHIIPKKTILNPFLLIFSFCCALFCVSVLQHIWWLLDCRLERKGQLFEATQILYREHTGSVLWIILRNHSGFVLELGRLVSHWSFFSDNVRGYWN